MPESSASILDRFRHHSGATINLTLSPPYLALLEKIGNPQRNLPPVVHVAGTNGKGSTCAFLRAMVEAAGFKAHVFTSPHLVTFHERIRIAGELIGEEELVEILKTCEKVGDEGEITYFEAATAAAFVAFANHPADITLLEVGLGGRLDSTNVVPAPTATVITRLSFDHRDYLGATMTTIAREKAGIMRLNVPCFTAAQPSLEALETLRQEARNLHAPLSVGDKDWRVEPLPDGFRFTSPHRTLDLPPPMLIGQHQYQNAGLALATLGAVPLTIPDSAIRKAMTNVEWPARLQRLRTGKLAELLPQEWELWLDGGHNDSAGEILATQIAAWREQDRRPLRIIFGMLSTKEPQEFLGPFASFVERLRAVTIENEPQSRSAENLTALARSCGISDAAPSQNLVQALQELAHGESPKGRILICGSLYLAGQALSLNAKKA